MKKRFYSIGSIIILLLAAVTFVIIPAIVDNAGGRNYPDYGKFNGKSIRFEENSDFSNEVNSIIRMDEQNGIDFNSEYANFFYQQAFNKAFQKVISDYSFEQYSKSIGYKVPQSTINKTIKSLPMFLDGSYTFSEALYKKTPEKDKREIHDNVNRILLIQRSKEDVLGSIDTINKHSLYGLKYSSAEIDFITKMGSKLYSFDIATFNLASYPDSEKAKFGNAHKDIFEKFNLKVISLDTKDKANEVLNRINKSEITFEDAITEYSTNYYGDHETGIVGASYKYQLENAVVNKDDLVKITSLQKDNISPIIETPSGYCIFKAFDNSTSPDFSNTQTFADVYEYLQTREKSVIEEFFVAKAKDFTGKAISSTFDQACSEYNIEKSTVSQIALNYGAETLIGPSTYDSKSVMNYVTTNENFLKTVFKLKKEEVSSPLVLSNSNMVVVVKCTDISNKDIASSDNNKNIASEIKKVFEIAAMTSLINNEKVEDNSSEFIQAFFSN